MSKNGHSETEAHQNGETDVSLVKASGLESVVWRIYKLRNPSAEEDYKKELAEYQRQRGKRKEVEAEQTGGPFKGTVRGFYKLVDGKPEFHPRPELTRPRTWAYLGYARFASFTTHAKQFGLLADPLYNRDIRLQRVEEYEAEMQAGNWRDLVSDPIAITSEGQVLNGQHRLAAASDVDWDKAGNDPLFLVVWGAKPEEALYADGSRRTPKDMQVIAARSPR